jgi:hypothetical protein
LNKRIPLDSRKETAKKVGIEIGLAQRELYIAELERKVVRRTAFRMAGEEVVCDKTDHDTQADEMRRWCWRARAVRLTKGSVAQNGTATLGSTGSTDSVIGLVLG